MTPDDERFERYADLRDGDPGIDHLMRALDSLYGQGEPPAHMSAEFEWALEERAVASLNAGGIAGGWWRSRRDGIAAVGRVTDATGTKGSGSMRALRGMTSRRISTWAAAAAAVVVVGLMAVLLRGLGTGGPGSGGTSTPSAQNVFAHSGGVEVIAQLSCLDSAPKCDLAAAQRQVVTILTQRLSSALNVPALDVRPLAADGIAVDVAGADPVSDILPLLTHGGFAVLDTGPTQLNVGAGVSGQTCSTGCQPGQYQVVFTSADLDTASVQAGLDRQNGQPVITFTFAGQARSRFAQYTGSHIGQFLTMVIDNKVVESAVIQSQIDGAGQISGVGSAQQARNLAVFMKYGALPAALKIVSTRTVAAGSNPQSGPFVCPTPSPFWQPCSGQSGTPCVTPTPGVTPGPQAKHVQNVRTAAGVDSTDSPVNITSSFPVNSDVYVAASVRDITAGQSHTISIHWFLDNQDVQLVPSVLSKTITQNSNVYFQLRYPTPGLGMAKLYFDRPANDPAGDTAYLAAAIDFAIQNPGEPVPTPTPTPIGGAMPTPTATLAPAASQAGNSGSGGGPTCPGPTPAPGPTPTPTWTSSSSTATPGSIPPQGPTPTPTPFG